MVHLDLTREEAEELCKVLKTYATDLRVEIIDTDASEFKEKLRDEKGVVKALVERLTAALEGQQTQA
jgi:hypothetical protein